MSIQCPRCGLLNPDDARRCDCGWKVGSAAHEDFGDIEAGGGFGKELSWFATGVCALLIVLSEGLRPLVLWNLAPLGLAAAATAFLMEDARSVVRRFAAGFVTGLLVSTGVFHLMWMFDIGGTQTGASTAAVALVFVPIVAVAMGAGVGAVTALATWLSTKRLR